MYQKKVSKIIFLICLIQSIIFPMKLKSQPLENMDYLYYGMGIGMASSLCDFHMGKAITTFQANMFLGNMLKTELTQGNKEHLQYVKDGFNGMSKTLEGCTLKAK